ncbi:hypothetical protein R1flu_025620 [Riccia fluitans]|uniref:Cytochrome P450 n=1 Tax=Riccia fluitans TaxID=41844 RepID=A0ABD1XY97_9MARC
MYPVTPLGLPHEAMEDTEVAGYGIPKGTRILVNLYGLGRDPASWADPNTVSPQRFTFDNPRDVRGRNFEILPFVSGRRMCPGMDMGLKRVEMTVAQVLQTCTLSLHPGVEVDVEEGRGITLPKAHPLRVLVTPRLQPELYTQSGESL